MLVKGIKSRPVYGGVAIDPNAKKHLFVLEGEAALCLADQKPPATEMAKADILYVPHGDVNQQDVLKALQPNDFWAALTLPPLLGRLDVVLLSSRMGMRLYIAGTEGFIGQAMRVALAHGIDFNAIKTEHRGSEERRVQCVHCKGVTDHVKTQPVMCSHCGLSLLVRDHYSRRIGAFQGVCIDAEEPGTGPAPEVAFP
ncbi:MAG: dimethylamine monooxygenase subunit DmmA family protein [Hyphomicrobiales bacterium]